jgi:hypothetical protein
MNSTIPNEALSLNQRDDLFPLSPPEQKRGGDMWAREKEEEREEERGEGEKRGGGKGEGKGERGGGGEREWRVEKGG